MSPSKPVSSGHANDIPESASKNLHASRARRGEEMSTSYGFDNVAEGEKQPLVNDVFHKVASRYDLMNDLMSMGLHRQWKNMMISALAPPMSRASDWHCLDVAGGTGDIALRVARASHESARITVLDINSSMLEEGKKRVRKCSFCEKIDFVEGNAEELPFANTYFNAYTIAFGIRNVPDINRALREAFRVLKSGGRFLCLEFSEVDLPMLDSLYDQWSMRVIPKIGQWVTGDRRPYRYLVESIRKFPDQATFATMIAKAGFEKITARNYTGGVAALHSGWKI